MPSKITMKFLTLVSCTFCMFASADTIKFQIPACISEEALDEFTRYIIDQDTQGMMQLMANGDCIVLMRGDNVSVIKRGFNTSTIRVLGTNYYTASESLAPGSNNQTLAPPQIKHQAPKQQSSTTANKTDLPDPNLDIIKFRIQAISTESKEIADEVASTLRELGYQVKIKEVVFSPKIIYRVYTEVFQDKEKAIETKKRIDQSLNTNSLVLRVTN